MKKNNYDLSELDDEKLIKRRNMIRGFLIGIGIIWLFMLAFMIYLFATKDTSEFSFGVFLPIFILPVALTPLFVNVVLMNKEIDSRGL